LKRKMKKWMALTWLVSLLLMAVVGLAQADSSEKSAPEFPPSTTLENPKEVGTSKENNSSGSALMNGEGAHSGQAKSGGGVWGWLADHGKGLLYGAVEGVVVAAGVVAVGALLSVGAPVLAVAAGAAVLGAAAYGLFTGAERFNVWECGVYSLIAAVSAGVGQGLAAAGLAGRGLAVARAAVDVVGAGLAGVASYVLHSPHPTWGGAAEAFGLGAATAGFFLGFGYGWAKLKALLGWSGKVVSSSGSAAVAQGVTNSAERGAVEAEVRAASQSEVLERLKSEVPQPTDIPANKSAHEIADEIRVSIKSHPIRMEYESKVRELANLSEELRSNGKSAEEIARTLHEARRALGVQYKDLTPPLLREYIYEINMLRYQDPLGPSFDFLVQKATSRGMTLDEAYEDIIRSATHPNDNVDKLLQGFSAWLDKRIMKGGG
jgi:hypothetical protein